MLITLKKANITRVSSGKTSKGVEYSSFDITDGESQLTISANGWDTSNFPILEPVKAELDVQFYKIGYFLGAKLNSKVAPVIEVF